MHMGRLRFCVVLLLGMAIPCVAPAAAQDFTGVFDMGSLTAGLSVDGVTLAEEKRSGTGRYARETGRAATTHVNLGYRPDPALRRKHFAQFVAQARRQDPVGAAKLQQVLANENVIGTIQAGITPYGMSCNDVADAATVYLAYAWMATRANDQDPTRAQMRGLRSQVATAMARNPAFAHATNAAKQEVADANLVQALLAGQLAAHAKQDPASRDKIRAAVARGAKSSWGIDLLSLNLTGQGLRR
jgi:hypothetical protein